MQKTYAKKGSRPVIFTEVVSQKCVRVAVAITPQGGLFYEVRRCGFKSQAVVRFVKNLMKAWRKNLLLIWDGAPIHNANVMKDHLKTQEKARKKVFLARFPPYSPMLNPAEQVWNYLKNHALKNIACKTTDELFQRVVQALEDLKKQPERIKAFFKHPDCGFYLQSGS